MICPKSGLQQAAGPLTTQGTVFDSEVCFIHPVQ